MKDGIHPSYAEAKFTCTCGNEVVTKSTKPGDGFVEICSACHPFYTGKERLVDTAGRIDRFRRKYAQA